MSFLPDYRADLREGAGCKTTAFASLSVRASQWHKKAQIARRLQTVAVIRISWKFLARREAFSRRRHVSILLAESLAFCKAAYAPRRHRPRGASNEDPATMRAKRFSGGVRNDTWRRKSPLDNPTRPRAELSTRLRVCPPIVDALGKRPERAVAARRSCIELAMVRGQGLRDAEATC